MPSTLMPRTTSLDAWMTVESDASLPNESMASVRVIGPRTCRAAFVEYPSGDDLRASARESIVPALSTRQSTTQVRFLATSTQDALDSTSKT
eukprot:2385670-Rhodomonas_salina.1